MMFFTRPNNMSVWSVCSCASSTIITLHEEKGEKEEEEEKYKEEDKEDENEKEDEEVQEKGMKEKIEQAVEERRVI